MIPTALPEHNLCRYVASLAYIGLTFQTIRTYPAAAEHLHILLGHGDLASQIMPVLEYVLKVTWSDQAKEGEGKGASAHNPISYES